MLNTVIFYRILMNKITFLYSHRNTSDILRVNTPSNPGVGSKGQNFFLKAVMLHIKLKEMENRAPRKYIFCPYTHPQSQGWGQKVKNNSESNHDAYQISIYGA